MGRGVGATGRQMGAWALGLWGFAARRPALYRAVTGLAVHSMRIWSMGALRIRRMPLAGAWLKHRDLPVPERGTFMQQYRASGHTSRKHKS